MERIFILNLTVRLCQKLNGDLILFDDAVPWHLILPKLIHEIYLDFLLSFGCEVEFIYQVVDEIQNLRFKYLYDSI
jgi:hypothetical protein